MNKALLIVTFFAVSWLSLLNQASGGDWFFIETSKDGNMSIFVDKKSVNQVSEDIVKSCQKFSYVKPIFFNNSKKPINALVACREWDCDDAKYNNTQLTFHYADGTKETETYQFALWHYVRQDSPEYDLFEYVCTHE